jgi:hypothetical protein
MMACVVTTFTFTDAAQEAIRAIGFPRLHRRMAAILAHLGAPMSDLVGKFYPLSLAGEDAVLARANHQGAVLPTPLFARL